MPARDLWQNPIWQGAELGRPIPASPHAVSMALPRWADVIGYEEKKPEVINALEGGYPKWEFSEAYEAVRRADGGWGALITFLPRNGEAKSGGIYDRLALCKGPSLGTIFTLACPFTLLAHYTELEWAESCGVSRHLIRISVGLEDPEDLWQRLEKALAGP